MLILLEAIKSGRTYSFTNTDDLESLVHSFVGSICSALKVQFERHSAYTLLSLRTRVMSSSYRPTVDIPGKILELYKALLKAVKQQDPYQALQKEFQTLI